MMTVSVYNFPLKCLKQPSGEDFFFACPRVVLLYIDHASISTLKSIEFRDYLLYSVTDGSISNISVCQIINLFEVDKVDGWLAPKIRHCSCTHSVNRLRASAGRP